MKIGNW